MNLEHITLTISESVALITLNRPDNLNAFTGRMMSELIDTFDAIDRDDSVALIFRVTMSRRAPMNEDASGSKAAQ